jgi:hypothetical protein
MCWPMSPCAAKIWDYDPPIVLLVRRWPAARPLDDSSRLYAAVLILVLRQLWRLMMQRTFRPEVVSVDARGTFM